MFRAGSKDLPFCVPTPHVVLFVISASHVLDGLLDGLLDGHTERARSSALGRPTGLHLPEVIVRPCVIGQTGSLVVTASAHRATTTGPAPLSDHSRRNPHNREAPETPTAASRAVRQRNHAHT